jgi:hypothetical protein
MDRKASVMRAIERFEERQLKEAAHVPKRKNDKPEQRVVRQICAWLKSNGFSYNVVEAKATFDPDKRRYTTGQVSSGFSDIVAVSPDGYACFLEIKANGRRGSLKEHQRAFLLDKISCNAFAGVFDSVERLSRAYNMFSDLRRAGRNAQNYLQEMMPKKRRKDTGKLFP